MSRYWRTVSQQFQQYTASAAVVGASRCRASSSNGTTASDSFTEKKTMHFGIDPAHLNLNLDLDSMNFAEIVNSTKRAMSSDTALRRHWKDLDTYVTEPPVKQQAPPSLNDSGTKECSGDAVGEKTPAAPHHSVRGIVSAGAVHDSNTPTAAYAQHMSETGGRTRHTLMDSLRDCTLSGNWKKAYVNFQGAVDKACNSVLTASRLPMESGPSTQGRDKVEECLEALYKVNATLPPARDADRQASYARRQNKQNLAGVMRWNGGHYYFLIKSLIDANCINEVEEVWDLMKKIGFVQFHIEEKTVNSLLALLRNTEQVESITRLVAPGSGTNVTQAADKTKKWKRLFAIELEEVAKTHGFHLKESNERTAQMARIAHVATHSHDLKESSSEGQKVILRVGDFNSLLRIATTHEGTERVLAMMQKLSIPKDSTTYASIIHSIRNPNYRTSNGTEEEFASQTASWDEGEEVDDEDADVQTNAKGKLKYEKYLEERIGVARKWFHECPESARTADVYNQLLLILKGKKYSDDFNEVLRQFRGVVLRSASDMVLLGSAKDNEGSGDNKVVLPTLVSPQWRTPPNGQTYDILIQRCRYFHDWEAMWTLYDEMRVFNVSATLRLYQMLITEAKQHPPASAMDKSSFLLQLYDDMKRNSIDVESVSSTLNLVNAWSSLKSRRRWL